jgi:pyruvate/2-oxoglutarate dehydrogenase complex dihydrolipoamide dehydrogenase (E3) component
MSKYDAIIIGSGQAGNPLSTRLADRGWRVVLIEECDLGGTCINTGCTPTKTMVASAQVAHYARHAAEWGVRAADVRVDLPSVIARKDRVVGQLRSGLERKIPDHPNVRLVRGHARFVAPHRVRVNDDEELAADRIFIDTGARPDIPALAGLDRVPYLTNASLLDLRDLPDHLIVLGGGYVGVEFGQMFRRFGSAVTIVHHGRHILSREDPDVAAELQRVLVGEGIRLVLHSRPARVDTGGGRVVVEVDGPNGPQVVADGSHLLVAVGRRPNTDGLGLDRAGIGTDPEGFIRVNARLETSVPGVWALGDVNGGPAFTHISYNDYQIVYANLVEGKSLSTAGRVVPYAVFADPELGRVGLTEQEARAAGRKLKIGTVPTANVARAIERGETAGLMKVVIDADSDRVLGAAVLASNGGELVHVFTTLMLAGAPYTLLKGAIYVHPTMAEGLWSLFESVRPAD